MMHCCQTLEALRDIAALAMPVPHTYRAILHDETFNATIAVEFEAADATHASALIFVRYQDVAKYHLISVGRVK